MTNTKSIYDTGLFHVEVVDFTDPVLNERLGGYGVFNTTTGIREAECRRLFTAKALADGFTDQQLFPEKYIDPAPVIDGGGARH